MAMERHGSGWYAWYQELPRFKYQKPRTLIRRIPKLVEALEGTTRVWYDRRTKHHEVGIVWSAGPKRGTRWVIPHNPALATHDPRPPGLLIVYVGGSSDLDEFLKRNSTVCRESLYELREPKVSG